MLICKYNEHRSYIYFWRKRWEASGKKIESLRDKSKRPKLPANIELRNIALGLTAGTPEAFSVQLELWYRKYGDWLKERTFEFRSGRMRYAHERTRRAYFSLKRNLPYLFTCQSKILEELGATVPNTSNALDGLFGAIKSKLKLHRGASKTLRIKLFCNFLSGRTEVRKHR